MNPKYVLSLIRIMKTPGLIPIIRDWQAFIRMNFIFAACDIGLLNALKTPCDKDNLIAELNIKRPAILDALLDVGLAAKELALKNGLYSIKGKRSKSISSAKGDVLAALIQANLTYYSSVYRNAADRMRGGDLGDDLKEIGTLVARFSKIAEPLLKEFIASLVRGRQSMRVLDVGCGSGILLQSTHSYNRNAKGIGVDIDEAVVQQAKQNISSWGLADRFDILHGNILHTNAITGPFDLISLYNILYYFDPVECLNLMHKLRRMISETGVLAIAMSFRSRGKDIASANLNMANSSLKGLMPLPDLDEITSVLTRCGFCRIEVHRFLPGSTFYGIAAHSSAR